MRVGHFARALLLGLYCLLACPGAVLAEGKRYALLIGVNEYREVTKLAKAVGDAEALAAALTAFGYATEVVTNPDRRELNASIARFAAKLGPDDTAFVHFSGHGIEIAQQNFLLPADVPLPPEDIGSGAADFIRGETLALSDLMARITASPAAVRIFVIDACRNNPFAVAGTRGVGTTRGLNVREAAPAGAFVFYSAGVGQQALDSLSKTDPEPTSVYTRVLLKHLTRPQSVAEIAQNVRREVRDLARRAGHTQAPAYYDEFIGSNEFYIDPAKDPRAGWLPLCQGPTPSDPPGGWLHNGQRFTLVSDGDKRRFHYVEPRPAIRNNGVTPNCVLVDGEAKDGKLKGVSHIYRENCGMYPYAVEGEFSDAAERIELKGSAPIPADNCRIIRFEDSGPNSSLVFTREVALPAAAPGETSVAPAAPQ